MAGSGSVAQAEFFFKIGETSVSLNIYDKNPVERELLTIQKRKRYLILYDS